MKVTWGHGPWGWGHIVYCPQGCLICILPVAVKSRGYVPRTISKRDKTIAIENVSKHNCLRKEGQNETLSGNSQNH